MLNFELTFLGGEMQVVFELLLGFVFCMWAALTAPGKFLSIHPYSEENRYDVSSIGFRFLIRVKFSENDTSCCLFGCLKVVCVKNFNPSLGSFTAITV